MPNAYAQALIQLIKGGDTPHAAVEKVHAALARRGRAGLMRAIARAFERRAAHETLHSDARLIVARASDATHVLARVQRERAHVIVDESLIGGWRLEEKQQITDASWKHYLLFLYNRIIRA